MTHTSNRFFAAALLIPVFALVGCGQRAEQKIVYAQNGGNVTNNNSNSSTNTAPLSCTATPSATSGQVYVNAAGAFITGLAPAPIKITLSGSAASERRSIAIDNIGSSIPSGFTVASQQTKSDGSVEVTIRLSKAATHNFTFTVHDSQMSYKTASCTTAYSLTAVPAPVIVVKAAVNGQEGQALLSPNEPLVLSWFSTNALSCAVLRPGAPAMFGLSSGSTVFGPQPNGSATAQETIFKVQCFGSQLGGDIGEGTVRVVLNPLPQLNFKFEGDDDDKFSIRPGGSAKVLWSTTYATGGCKLHDGVSEVAVDATGEKVIADVSASRVIKLTCSDTFKGVITKELQLNVKNPSLSLLANGAGGTVTPSGGSVRISWSSKDMNSCSVAGRTGLSGAFDIASPSQATTYTLKCESDFGSHTDTVTVRDVGHWYQVDGAHCPSFCGGIGRANVASPTGQACSSGEQQIPYPSNKVAFGDFSYIHGTWSQYWGPGVWYVQTVSVGGECYQPGQKQDHDSTDITVACFCK